MPALIRNEPSAYSLPHTPKQTDASGNSLVSPYRKRRMAVPRFYYTRHHLRNGEPQIPWTADGIFGSPKNLDRAADRVLPRHRVRVQVVIHVENRIVDVVGDGGQSVLGNGRVEHDFGAGKDQCVGVILGAHLLFNQVRQEICVAM